MSKVQTRIVEEPTPRPAIHRGVGVIRCPYDGRMLAETIEPGGRHRIRCPRCKSMIEFETWPDSYEPRPTVAEVRRLRS